MAENPTDNINEFLLEIENCHKNLLGQIRHWDNLKAAFDQDTIWIKNIRADQVEHVEIQSIPYKKIYYLKDNMLFLKGSLLPAKKIRSGLLWSALAQLIPVVLPASNNNFFRIDQKIRIRILPGSYEQQPYAMLVSKEQAQQYIETAPKIRLKNLLWIVIEDTILIVGNPLLPISGLTFWLFKDLLIPAGYDFEFPLLRDTIADRVNPMSENLVLWQKDGSYVILAKDQLKPLSISSFRLTFSKN